MESSEPVTILDSKTEQEVFHAQVGYIPGEPMVIGAGHFSGTTSMRDAFADMGAELQFDMLRYVMEGEDA